MHKKFLAFSSILSLTALFMVLTPGCGSSVTYEKLLADPAAYNGKVVTFDAFYFSGFEIQVLASGLAHPPSSKDWVPAPRDIWITGNMPQDVIDQMRLQTNTPSGYDERYGKVRVTGTFQYGGSYGHLDGYQYQLVVSGASVLRWTPS